MDIQDLRILCRLAAVGNLSAVGAEFKLSAGTISKRLQAMESELRVRLFARTTRSIRITQEGEMFLGRAQRILHEFDIGISALGDNSVSPRGRIKIASPAYLGATHVSVAVGAFLKAFPDIDVEPEVTDRPVNLHDEGFDAAIMSGAHGDRPVNAHRLGPDPQVLVASPDYLSMHGTPSKPQQLEFHSCLVLDDNWQWMFVQRGKYEPVRVRGRLTANDCGTILSAALAGLGIARLSAARVAVDIEAGRLVTILAAYDATGDASLWALHPAGTHTTARLRAFLDFMSDWFAQRSTAQVTEMRPKKANSRAAGDGGLRAVRARS